MADGILCKHCGWQETDHESVRELELTGHDKRIQGYRKTLMSCTGFEGETEPKEMSEQERLCLEQRARARFAWGYFSAQMRQVNYNRALQEHNRAVRNAGGETRQKAVEKREKFIEDAKAQNHGFWVG